MSSMSRVAQNRVKIDRTRIQTCPKKTYLIITTAISAAIHPRTHRAADRNKPAADEQKEKDGTDQRHDRDGIGVIEDRVAGCVLAADTRLVYAEDVDNDGQHGERRWERFEGENLVEHVLDILQQYNVAARAICA